MSKIFDNTEGFILGEFLAWNTEEDRPATIEELNEAFKHGVEKVGVNYFLDAKDVPTEERAHVVLYLDHPLISNGIVLKVIHA